MHEIDEARDDFVVLASDGLWDHVTNAEAVEIVRNAAYVDGEPEAAGDRLIMVSGNVGVETFGRRFFCIDNLLLLLLCISVWGFWEGCGETTRRTVSGLVGKMTRVAQPPRISQK